MRIHIKEHKDDGSELDKIRLYLGEALRASLGDLFVRDDRDALSRPPGEFQGFTLERNGDRELLLIDLDTQQTTAKITLHQETKFFRKIEKVFLSVPVGYLGDLQCSEALQQQANQALTLIKADLNPETLVVKSPSFEVQRSALKDNASDRAISTMLEELRDHLESRYPKFHIYPEELIDKADLEENSFYIAYDSIQKTISLIDHNHSVLVELHLSPPQNLGEDFNVSVRMISPHSTFGKEAVGFIESWGPRFQVEVDLEETQPKFPLSCDGDLLDKVEGLFKKNRKTEAANLIRYWYPTELTESDIRRLSIYDSGFQYTGLIISRFPSEHMLDESYFSPATFRNAIRNAANNPSLLIKGVQSQDPLAQKTALQFIKDKHPEWLFKACLIAMSHDSDLETATEWIRTLPFDGETALNLSEKYPIVVAAANSDVFPEDIALELARDGISRFPLPSMLIFSRFSESSELLKEKLSSFEGTFQKYRDQLLEEIERNHPDLIPILLDRLLNSNEFSDIEYTDTTREQMVNVLLKRINNGTPSDRDVLLYVELCETPDIRLLADLHGLKYTTIERLLEVFKESSLSIEYARLKLSVPDHFQEGLAILEKIDSIEAAEILLNYISTKKQHSDVKAKQLLLKKVVSLNDRELDQKLMKAEILVVEFLSEVSEERKISALKELILNPPSETSSLGLLGLSKHLGFFELVEQNLDKCLKVQNAQSVRQLFRNLRTNYPNLTGRALRLIMDSSDRSELELVALSSLEYTNSALVLRELILETRRYKEIRKALNEAPGYSERTISSVQDQAEITLKKQAWKLDRSEWQKLLSDQDIIVTMMSFGEYLLRIDDQNQDLMDEVLQRLCDTVDSEKFKLTYYSPVNVIDHLKGFSLERAQSACKILLKIDPTLADVYLDLVSNYDIETITNILRSGNRNINSQIFNRDFDFEVDDYKALLKSKNLPERQFAIIGLSRFKSCNKLVMEALKDSTLTTKEEGLFVEALVNRVIRDNPTLAPILAQKLYSLSFTDLSIRLASAHPHDESIMILVEHDAAIREGQYGSRATVRLSDLPEYPFEKNTSNLSTETLKTIAAGPKDRLVQWAVSILLTRENPIDTFLEVLPSIRSNQEQAFAYYKFVKRFPDKKAKIAEFAGRIDLLKKEAIPHLIECVLTKEGTVDPAVKEELKRFSEAELKSGFKNLLNKVSVEEAIWIAVEAFNLNDSSQAWQLIDELSVK